MADAVYGALGALAERGDLDVALAHINVEFTSMVAEAEGTTCSRPSRRACLVEEYRGTEDVRWELLDFQGSGDRAVSHIRMAGTLSGVPVEQTMWQAVKLRQGPVELVGLLSHRG